jgi:flagellar biosynthesis protein FlhB
VILIFLILNRTALRNFFQDIGYPLLITGLILLVIILMVKTVPSMLEKQLTPELQKLTLDQKELVLSFINYLTGQIKSWITVLTFCFVGGGVIMIITAYFFPGAKKVVPKQQ